MTTTDATCHVCAGQPEEGNCQWLFSEDENIEYSLGCQTKVKTMECTNCGSYLITPTGEEELKRLAVSLMVRGQKTMHIAISQIVRSMPITMIVDSNFPLNSDVENNLIPPLKKIVRVNNLLNEPI